MKSAPGSGKARRGFASMSKEKQRELASMGGKAAHAKGVGHEWTSEEARAAGRKGGAASSASKARRAMEQGQGDPDAEARASET